MSASQTPSAPSAESRAALWRYRETAVTAKPPRILLVDDQEKNLEPYAQELRKRGFEVTAVCIDNTGHAKDRADLGEFLASVIQRRQAASPDRPLHLADANAVAQYALRSSNGIDGVVTDLGKTIRKTVDGEDGPWYETYGDQIAARLKDIFHGPVVVHSSQLSEANKAADPKGRETYDTVTKRLTENGATGTFAKGDWDDIADCLREGIENARQQGRRAGSA